MKNPNHHLEGHPLVQTMPNLTLSQSSSKSVQPLSAEEAERAEQVAARLVAALATLVGTLPEQARGASGMARHLSVVRNSCQRVVSALAEASVTPGILARLPGVKGLEQLIEGFEAAGADEADIAAAQSAIEQFERLIRDIARSQSRLAARLAASPLADGERTVSQGWNSEKARRDLFATAVGVTGRQCNVNLSIYAFRLHPDDPARLERVLASGQIGQLARPDAIPFAFSAGDTHGEHDGGKRQVFSSLDQTPAHGHTPNAVLDEFSTDPLPVVTSRGSEGRVVQMIDASTSGGEPVDLVIANRSVHPAIVPETGKPSLDSVWTLINYPARRLILDIYLHKSMERHFRPSTEAQLWGPNLDIHPADRWITRFADGPRLELLGAGLSNASTDGYARHADLTEHLFDQVGWNGRDFVGFRCEVVYPIWRAGYCMLFTPVDDEPSQ